MAWIDKLVEHLRRLGKSGDFLIFATISLGLLAAYFLLTRSYRTETRSARELRKEIEQSSSRVPSATTGQSETGKRTAPTRQNQEAATKKVLASANTLPRVSFANYSVETSLPESPSTASVHQLAGDLTVTDAQALAQRIGFEPTDVDEGINIISLVGENTELGESVLIVNKKTGTFFFASEHGVKLETTSVDPKSTARRFLSQSGVLSGNPECFVYRAETHPGSILVECHRSWQDAGLPVLSAMGMLNLDPNRKLSQLEIGGIDQKSPQDANVVFAEGGASGRARPNEFNTATVEIDGTTGAIRSVTSSIRKIAQSRALLASDLMTATECIEALERGGESLSLTNPTGEGFVPQDKMYPDNIASSTNPKINDIIYAYLEASPDKPQDALLPYCVVRGQATLASGYDVSFVQALPALKNGQTARAILGEATDRDSGELDVEIVNPGQSSTLQYGTFGFEPQETTTPPTPGSTCPPDLTNAYKLGDGGWLAWKFLDIKRYAERVWYYIPPKGQNVVVDDAKVSEIRLRRINVNSKCMPRLPAVCPAPPEIRAATQCFFITTQSPTLYLYPTRTTDVSVTVNPSGTITYRRPSFSDEARNQWRVTVDHDGTITMNDSTYPSLYYEYEKEPVISEIEKRHDDSRAFVVAIDGLDSFVRDVGGQMGLNAQEINDLAAEVNRETATLSKKDVTHLEVSFVQRALLDKYLPVKVDPKPTTFHRIHLFIRPMNQNASLMQPSLPAITRSGFTVVETGVIVDLASNTPGVD